MQLTKGARLGPYEILAPLGAGGMGEVYRARDSRLGRTVAIKILPAEFSENSKLQLRFEREAKAISSLNHPNICALYDVGEITADGRKVKYLVMEYLEGETLEKRLKRGPLPLDQVLRYGLEIADALDRAHRGQILHRDLKPSNIMITKSGARLLDFGLAKSLTDESLESSRSLATPEKSITAGGSVVGTLEYMAPEQLQGLEPDARTDVFSFGVSLYQMITGRRPFQGSSRASLIASILEHEPPAISTFQPGIPASLEWLVKNSLTKDPDERIQTAHDVKLELKRIAEETRTSAPAAVPRPVRRTWLHWGTAVIGILVLAAVILTMRQMRIRNSGTSVIKRFSISLPPSAAVAEGRFEKLAVSPDGTRVVYVGVSNLTTQLYLYTVATQEIKPLPDTEGAMGPFFSPDGQWIGFSTAARELKKIPVAVARSAVLSKGHNVRGACWGPNNTIVFAEPFAPLQRISASGGSPEVVAPYDPRANVRWPSFLPGDEWILYTVSDFSGDYENAVLAVRSLRTGQNKVVLKGATYGRYVPTGHLAYFHAQTLFFVPFDRRELRITGQAVPAVADVDSYFAQGLAHFAFASDGSLFYLPRSSAESGLELVWVSRTGQSTPITPTRRTYEEPKLSPDGKRLLVTIGPRPRSDLWLYDIARDTWTRLTTEATNEAGIWSPDGTQIAFASNKDGSFGLYTMVSDQSAPPRQVVARRNWDFPTSWSPDGKTIAVIEQFRATLTDIFIVALEPRATPMPFVVTPFEERGGAFSPDGHWIAYQSNESGVDEIYVQPYPGRGRKWLVSTDGGTYPVWSRDGAELFYRNGNKMMSVATQLGSEFVAGKPGVLFEGEFDEAYDVTPDGQRFVMVKMPKESLRTQINVVLGLFDNLQR